MNTWTSADLASLDKAIATGATKVRFADNREVTYRSLADMRSIRKEIVEALTGSVPIARTTFVEHSRD
ncbi:phage head-tail joining protein [uncultured Methylobacterium sp.]|uniref:phage head-tail joining protein n=1 Tax=uncultured Methylobacterium sp. TaxID=157278 RepID=UPI0035CA7DDD